MKEDDIGRTSKSQSKEKKAKMEQAQAGKDESAGIDSAYDNSTRPAQNMFWLAQWEKRSMS